MKKFKHTFREGLPGGPNEIKGTITGSVSHHGYKRNSPDVGNDFNIIPSQYITMVGVDFPVIGTDNLGNSKIMYPGNNYKFPGNYVTEIPAFGKGGLTQWFAEKWVDVKTGKECGRSGKDKNGRPYPACRPSKRVNETTPKTTSEMSSSEKAKFKREKTSGKRIDYNHKRAQNGIEVKGRNGSRQNPDGTVSTHLMAREYVPGRGWVAFPTLFQNPDSTWVEIPMDQGWGAAYEEALKRGEVYDFGQDEQAAIKFADQGSWKKQDGGNPPPISLSWNDPEYRDYYNRLDKDVVIADPSGKTAGWEFLDEIEIYPDKRNLQPYWDTLTEEEKRFWNDDGPIGRHVRMKAREGHGLTADDATNFVKALTLGPLDDALEIASIPSAAVAETVAWAKGDPYDYSNALPSFGTWNNTQRAVSETAADEVKWISDKTGIPEWAVGFGFDFASDPTLWVPATAAAKAPMQAIKTGTRIAKTGARRGIRTGVNRITNAVDNIPSRINPKYYNPTSVSTGNPDVYYRKVGKDAYEDFVNSGVLRTQAEVTDNPIMGLIETKRELGQVRDAIKDYGQFTYRHPTSFRAPYFSRGRTADMTSGADDYLFQTRPGVVGDDAFSSGQMDILHGSGNARVPVGGYGIMDPMQRSAENFDVFKKSWWHGYKPVRQEGGAYEPTDWVDYINPMNWFVTNRDQDGDFKQAFRAARNAGDDEFMWYGNRYSTELTQPSTPNANKNKKKPSSNVLDLNNTLNYLVDTRGGTRDLWGQAADNIAYHESWHTMDPTTIQANNGPARGMFQFEGPAFKTFKNRYKTVADSMGLDVDPAILNANSADELTAEQQYTAFLVNLIESKAVLKDFADGKMSIEDLWLQGHKNVEKPGDRESFRTSMQRAEEQGITGGYQSFAEGGEGGEDPPIKIPPLNLSALDAQFRNQAFGQAQESTYVANPMQGLTQFYEREESDNFGIEDVSYEAPNLTSKYAKNVNSQAGLDFQSLTDKYYRKYSAANRPEVAQIQQTLIDEGYLPALNENGRSNADGLFGPRTKQALKEYSLKSQSGLVLNSGAIPSEIGDTRCAAGMCSILEQQGINTAGLGIKYKDAWNMLENMNSVGESQTVYNIYDSPEFNNVRTAADIKSATRNVKRKSQTTADMYQVGDIVGLYWQNSSHHAETLGSKTHNTHVGFVSGFDANGQPIITHNVNGQVKNDRWDNLVTGWISRPTTASQVREVYQGDDYVNMEISPTVLDNYVNKRELTNPDPEKMSVVENVLKRVHYNAQVLPQKLGSSVDPTWLRNATAGILGNESAIGYNATRSRQEVEEADLKRKVGYTIQGKKDEDVSLGVGKVKFSSLDPFARAYFQVTSPEDLGDDNKNVDVTTYSLIRNYDLFSDYAQTFPQLELNEDDIRNMAILSHNQGTSRLLKLGRNADLQTVAEEVQRLRALYDSEIADVSSTNWRFFGETAGTLGMNVESAITGKSPASETYISKANRYGQTLYSDRKPGFRTLYEYMKATGIPATYDYREKIYQNYFDDEYRGTAAQNTALLNALQGS